MDDLDIEWVFCRFVKEGNMKLWASENKDNQIFEGELVCVGIVLELQKKPLTENPL